MVRLALIVAALAVSIALGAPARAQSPIANPQDLPELYARAMAAGDVDTIVSFYGPNSIVMTPEGPVAAGQEQIRLLMTRNFSGGAKLSMAFNQARIDGGGGHAVTVWDWVLTIAVEGRPEQKRHVRSMIYLQQAGERWIIAADMYQVLPQ